MVADIGERSGLEEKGGGRMAEGDPMTGDIGKKNE